MAHLYLASVALDNTRECPLWIFTQNRGTITPSSVPSKKSLTPISLVHLWLQRKLQRMYTLQGFPGFKGQVIFTIILFLLRSNLRFSSGAAGPIAQHRAGVAVQWVKLLPATLASPTVLVPVAPLPIQIPATMPGKAVDDGPCVWSHALTWET